MEYGFSQMQRIGSVASVSIGEKDEESVYLLIVHLVVLLRK